MCIQLCIFMGIVNCFSDSLSDVVGMSISIRIASNERICVMVVNGH